MKFWVSWPFCVELPIFISLVFVIFILSPIWPQTIVLDCMCWMVVVESIQVSLQSLNLLAVLFCKMSPLYSCSIILSSLSHHPIYSNQEEWWWTSNLVALLCWLKTHVFSFCCKSLSCSLKSVYCWYNCYNEKVHIDATVST